MRTFEKDHNGAEVNVEFVPRSREVGQSYPSSVLSTLYATYFCFFLVWKHKWVPAIFVLFVFLLFTRNVLLGVVLFGNTNPPLINSHRSRLLWTFFSLVVINWWVFWTGYPTCFLFFLTKKSVNSKNRPVDSIQYSKKFAGLTFSYWMDREHAFRLLLWLLSWIW